MQTEDDSLSNLRYNINYYGADFTVDGLVRRLIHDDFIIPNFQRNFVWKTTESSKFIESLLLGLPVPSLFFAKDKYSDKLIIIDGQQRLKSLQLFYENNFSLKGVISEFENKYYSSLSVENRRHLDNTIIHCIIITEHENSNGMFYLFERLNTTGTPLTSQEVRTAIYHGPFNDLLNELDRLPEWKKLYPKLDMRLEGQELILRFLSLYYNLDNYDGKMNEFLNDFMNQNRTLTHISENEMRTVFESTIHCLVEKVGNDAFLLNRSFNKTIFETVMLVVSKHLSKCETLPLKKIIDELKVDSGYLSLIKSATTGKKSLLERLAYFDSKISQAQ